MLLQILLQKAFLSLHNLVWLLSLQLYSVWSPQCANPYREFMVHHQDQITIVHSPKVPCTDFLFKFFHWLQDQICPCAKEQFWGSCWQPAEQKGIERIGRKMSWMKRNSFCYYAFNLNSFGCSSSVLKSLPISFNRKHPLVESRLLALLESS